MQQYYQHFPEIDNVKWTDYFLNEFFIKYKFYEKLESSAYNYVSYNDIAQYPAIKKTQ